VSVAAVLLCAGRGARLGLGVEDALAPLAGRPLFAWSLEALQRVDAIEAVVLVGPVVPLERALAWVSKAKVSGIVEGGKERQDSVAAGLRALPAACDFVAVHDSARPLVTPDLIGRVVGDALKHGAAIAAVPLADTLKRATLRVVDATVPREGLWCAQTPQVFRRDWLEAAHAAASVAATDDAALVEALGHRVHLCDGDALNLKVATSRDLELAEAWIRRTA
jgi:2-C-methyl-D-erythritol 4-phosphate cytidylyltransferase